MTSLRNENGIMRKQRCDDKCNNNEIHMCSQMRVFTAIQCKAEWANFPGLSISELWEHVYTAAITQPCHDSNKVTTDNHWYTKQRIWLCGFTYKIGGKVDAVWCNLVGKFI